MNTNLAANLLNFLSVLTIIVADASLDDLRASDVLDAHDTADFFFGCTSGSSMHLPDGRVLRVW